MLLMNDIHISKDHIAEFDTNWGEALSVCKERQIQNLVIGGDLFQSRSAQTLDVLLAVRDALIDAEQAGITVYLANGNHDKVNQEAIRGYCHVFDQHNNVKVADEYMTISDVTWDFVLHLFAYFPENGSFLERLETFKTGLETTRPNYLYLHEGINGALKHSSDNELPAHIFCGFEKVFVGHYHDRCSIDGTNIAYIGASRQHNFGEDDAKGYTVVYNDGSHEFIKNQANTRFQVIDFPVDQVDIHLLDWLDEIKAGGRYKVKVRIHSSSPEASGIDKNIILQAGASKVEIITEDTDIKEIIPTGLFEKFDNRKIRESYESFCVEKQIEDVSLGLFYLSKITVCGN